MNKSSKVYRICIKKGLYYDVNDTVQQVELGYIVDRTEYFKKVNLLEYLLHKAKYPTNKHNISIYLEHNIRKT